MKKISKAKIAVTYATALLEAAVEKKAAARVFADVSQLREALGAGQELVKYMANPLYGEADKTAVLTEVCKKLKLTETTLNCLHIVQENRRFGDLLPILDAFVHLYYQREGIVEVEVESVQKLSAAQDKKLSAVLEKQLQKKIVLVHKIYPELIGGLKVRFGSEMFDDTVAAKLNRLEIMMKGEE